ncbi:MAG: ferritin family protein [Planctomycetota bacterium]|jgi:rubrerythrin
MSKVDSDQEILEFAISKEVESYNFYLALARRVDTDEIREVFEDLAREELGHKSRLELELIKTGRTIQPQQEPGRSDRDYIISESSALLDMDYKDVLLLAMEKEEAAFRTYVNLVANARDGQIQDLLLALAEEEVKHKIRFETEYDLLLKNT